MKRILLAYDGTDVDRHALATTIELAKAFEADVAVVGVVELMPARVGGTMPWDEERHAADLDEAVAALRAAGIEAEAVLHPAGDPAATIEATPSSLAIATCLPSNGCSSRACPDTSPPTPTATS